MNETLIFHKNPNIVTRVIENEAILLPIYKNVDEEACLYTLNKDASKIWNLINEKRTVLQIKRYIMKEFNLVPREELEKEINKIFKELKEIKAIEL